jgi:hypothetical protein
MVTADILLFAALGQTARERMSVDETKYRDVVVVIRGIVRS